MEIFFRHFSGRYGRSPQKTQRICVRRSGVPQKGQRAGTPIARSRLPFRADAVLRTSSPASANGYAGNGFRKQNIVVTAAAASVTTHAAAHIRACRFRRRTARNNDSGGSSGTRGFR